MIPSGQANPLQRLRLRPAGVQPDHLVLKELGLDERYVPAADPSLQVDVLPQARGPAASVALRPLLPLEDPSDGIGAPARSGVVGGADSAFILVTV